MATIFSLPPELMLNALCSQFPCRDRQIRSLATLLSIRAAPCRNIVLHGLEATGKTSVTKSLLEKLSKQPDDNVNGNPHNDELRYAIIKSAECITGRHLFEQTVGTVSRALGRSDNVGRCENLAQLAVELSTIVEGWTAGNDDIQRLVLVFDGIDRQRDAPATLLPALARLAEIIPRLTTIFIVTSPRPNFLHLPGVPHLEFPAYTKPELIQILSLIDPTPSLPQGTKETRDIWTRYCSAIWDSLSKHSGRDILSFRSLSLRLWPRFIGPILSGQLNSSPFSKLMVANRSLFQNDSALIPSLTSTTTQPNPTLQPGGNESGIITQLPHISRLLLVASYLASYNAPRHDTTFFMKSSLSKRRKKGGGTALSRKPGVSKNRKISRKLLGPQAFLLERMLAIFLAIEEDAVYGNNARKGNGKEKKGGKLNGNADVLMAVGTLVSLRLLVRLGSVGQDVLDAGTRYRVAVGWEVIRGVARSVGIEVEDYLAD